MDVMNAAKIKRACGSVPTTVSEVVERAEALSEAMGGSGALSPGVLACILAAHGVSIPSEKELFQDVRPDEDTSVADDLTG